MDLFVNYDCSLQAANLYERSIKCLRRLMALEYSGPAAAPYPPLATQACAACRGLPMQPHCKQPGSGCSSVRPAKADHGPDPRAQLQAWRQLSATRCRQRSEAAIAFKCPLISLPPTPLPAGQAAGQPRMRPWPALYVPQKLKATAFKAVLAAIKSLDTWAGPIKSAAAAVALQPDAEAAAEGGAGAEGPEGEPTPPRDREVGWVWKGGGLGSSGVGDARPRWRHCLWCAQGSKCLQAVSLALSKLTKAVRLHIKAVRKELQRMLRAQEPAALFANPPSHRSLSGAADACVVQELQRILADKELKDALLSGIEAFNENAVKGEAGHGHAGHQSADTLLQGRHASGFHVALRCPAALQGSKLEFQHRV